MFHDTINYIYDEPTGLLTETWTGTSYDSAENDIIYAQER
jgi:hypothetical protein